MVSLTKDEFLNSTINLQELYNKKLNETQLEFWYDELKFYEIDKYKRVIGEFAKSQKTFPALSEVLNKIKGIQEQTVVKPIEIERVKCNVCHGSGLVKYVKKENGIDYEYLCKCFCDNAKQSSVKDLPLREYKDVFYYRVPSKEQEVKKELEFDYSQINF